MTISPNTPILNKILEKLESIDSRLTKLEEHVSIVSTRMYGYIKKESDIQENQATENIRRTLSVKYHYNNITISPLRNFYIPDSNNRYTDLDGCIIKKIIETWPTNTNRVRRAADNSRAYIIEAKHGLTKKLVDDKLLQFCKILETFEYIRTHKEEITNMKASQFDNMVLSYDLFDFPENILFIFASDDISDDVYNFIVSINEGKLSQEKYNEYIVKSFKENEIIREILDNKDIPQMIKNKIKYAKIPSDITSLFIPMQLAEDALPVDKVLETNKELLEPYSKQISELFLSYKSVADCYTMLLGRLAIYRLGEYYWDEDMFSPVHP